MSVGQTNRLAFIAALGSAAAIAAPQRVLRRKLGCRLRFVDRRSVPLLSLQSIPDVLGTALA